MEDGGFKWRERHVEDSTVFNDYHTLAQGDITQGGYRHAMLGAVDNIYLAITESTPIKKTGVMAIKVQRLCEQIKQRSLLKMENKNNG
jgi:hypothetical protein